MPTYALLLRASANRVYGDASFDLAAAELAVLDRTQLGGTVTATRRQPIAGVDYLLVDTTEPLTGTQLAVLANLSSLHAQFEVEGALFRPCHLAPLARMDEDVVTIQRYAGKTNEAFTHLLVNVALAESGDSFTRLLKGEHVHLIDPACGRGTSLNRAVVYGMDATGIELDQRDVEAYTQFILTWMKDKRLKHQLEQAKLRKGRDTPAHRITVTYGRGKDRAAHRVVDIIHDDTLGARSHLKARTMDLLVCDLPYGVQHGAQAAPGQLERGPAALLRRALPVWFDLLVPGAAMALAWNRNTLTRAALAELVTSAGFDLRTPADDDAFVHRVDRAILRDVLVAARPGS
ncbi:MAG: SAM-dependent methyltransferase [Acidimicrobiales bacterium]